MERTLICIGGGELKSKTTLAIDGYCAALAYRHAADHRPTALFVGTASHDSKTYFNTFRKTYTTVFDIKADLVLTVRGGEMDEQKLRAKFDAADLIYIGGGDTVYMLEEWRRTGLDKLIKAAYQRCVPIVGLSAGAICWFQKMYTDSDIVSGVGGEYRIHNGLGTLKGLMTPHYNHRPEFDKVVEERRSTAYAVEDNCALHWGNERLVRVVSCGGNAYRLDATSGVLEKHLLPVEEGLSAE